MPRSFALLRQERTHVDNPLLHFRIVEQQMDCGPIIVMTVVAQRLVNVDGETSELAQQRERRVLSGHKNIPMKMKASTIAATMA